MQKLNNMVVYCVDDKQTYDIASDNPVYERAEEVSGFIASYISYIFFRRTILPATIRQRLHASIQPQKHNKYAACICIIDRKSYFPTQTYDIASNAVYQESDQVCKLAEPNPLNQNTLIKIDLRRRKRNS